MQWLLRRLEDTELRGRREGSDGGWEEVMIDENWDVVHSGWRSGVGRAGFEKYYHGYWRLALVEVFATFPLIRLIDPLHSQRENNMNRIQKC